MLVLLQVVDGCLRVVLCLGWFVVLVLHVVVLLWLVLFDGWFVVLWFVFLFLVVVVCFFRVGV